MALLVAPATPEGRHASQQHRRKCHPEQPPGLFYIPKNLNTDRAREATKSKGRLHNILRAKGTGLALSCVLSWLFALALLWLLPLFRLSLLRLLPLVLLLFPFNTGDMGRIGRHVRPNCRLLCVSSFQQTQARFRCTEP